MAIKVFFLSFIFSISMHGILLEAQNPEINHVLDEWHAAAARADQQTYF